MVHLEGLARTTPQLPARGWTSTLTRLSVSAALHLFAAGVVVTLFAHVTGATRAERAAFSEPALRTLAHVVFLVRPTPQPGGGGGGGGNRQRAPIRRAEGIGHDAITLRTTPTAAPLFSDGHVEPAALPPVVLDARPLASGTTDVLGLPDGGVPFGTSTGPGSGGGVGDGSGTGIGSGRGPGIGPGSGGGTGGGVYKSGGQVSAPRVLREVKPTYTDDALARKIQGRVVLELVVNRVGRPEDIRVVRPLDPGLDERAIAAAGQWRFEPGRLAGVPVDVAVTLVLDFWIQ